MTKIYFLNLSLFYDLSCLINTAPEQQFKRIISDIPTQMEISGVFLYRGKL